ncbi:MAG TPA: flippase-like domain-containing protein [Natrialbaceae archaeon]|nr:flippase-like domain-containing protein [Natrialbaceae archaeon]
MDIEDLRATAVGFLAAAVVFAVLFWFVGVGRILRALGRADLRLVALVGLTMLGWLVAWSLALRTVLEILGTTLSVTDSFLAYASAAFANNVTPFGQAGGEPIAAMLIADAAGEKFETGLAAIASVDTLNFAPSITLATIGMGYYATTTALGPRLEVAAVSVAVLAVGVPTLVLAAWHRRYALERQTIRVLTPVFRRLGQVVPRVSPPDPETVDERIRRFFGSIERVATDRRGLAQALSFSALGWGCQAAALWLTFVALGRPISLAVPLIVVPVGAIASATPMPGGLGGIESVYILLLISTTGVGLPLATAAVIIHRVGGFWLATIVGAASMGTLRVRSRRAT